MPFDRLSFAGAARRNSVRPAAGARLIDPQEDAAYSVGRPDRGDPVPLADGESADFRSAVSQEPPDLLAQIAGIEAAGVPAAAGRGRQATGGSGLTAYQSFPLAAPSSHQSVAQPSHQSVAQPSHQSVVSQPAGSSHQSVASQGGQQAARPPLDFAELRRQADAKTAERDARLQREGEAVTMHRAGHDAEAIERATGIDRSRVPRVLAGAQRREPAAMSKKAIANSVFGVLAQDATSAPTTSGAGATAHRLGRGIMHGAEFAGRMQDFGEIGTFGASEVAQAAGSAGAGAVVDQVRDFSNAIGAPIGVGQASVSTLHQMANAGGQLGQAATKAAIDKYDDPMNVAVTERADANLMNAVGHMDIERIRANREQARDAAGSLPAQLPKGARFGPGVWQQTVRRIKAEDAKRRVLQSHGFTPERSFTQDETAAALGATVGEHEAGGRVERTLVGQDTAEREVRAATPGQKFRAGLGRAVEDVGQVMQGEDAAEALKDGDFGRAAWRSGVGVAHAVGNAAAGQGLSEVPVIGDLTNLTYNAATGVAGAALEHGSKAMFKNSHQAVQNEKLDTLHNAFNHQYREGDLGGGAEGEFVTPQERRNRYGLAWRERGEASKRDIVPQEPLSEAQIDRAKMGLEPMREGRPWAGARRRGDYLGNDAPLADLLARTRPNQVANAAPAALPAIPTGTGSDAESGWAPRKRGMFERMGRAIKRWWGTTKLGRRFKRGR